MADTTASLLLRITSEDDSGADLEKLAQALRNLGATDAEASVGVKGGPEAKVDLEQLQAGLNRIDGQKAEATVKVDTSKAKVSVSDLTGSITSLVKQSVQLTALGFAAQGIGALAGAAAALTSALAPAAGAIAAMPVAMSAMVQGMSVAKLGMMGMDKATEDFGKQFAQQTPVITALKNQLDTMAPALVHVKNVAQGRIMGGLVDALRTATPLIGVFTPIIARTATVLGGFARQAATTFSGPTWTRDISTLGNNNVELLKVFGSILFNVASAFRNVMVAAIPLTNFLAKMVQGWAQSANAAAASGRESGKLGAFFDRTAATISILVNILSSLGRIFGAVSRAAAPLGEHILGGINTALSNLADNANSVKGQAGLASYFKSLTPMVDELGRLVVDVGKAFVTLSTQPGLTKLIAAIRTDLLPIFVQVTAATTAAFGPVFIDAASNVLRLMAPILGASGPLTQFVRLLGGIAGVLADITGGSPAAQASLASIVGLAATFKAALLIGKFTGITALVSALSGVRAAYIAMAQGQTVADVAQKRGMATTIAARVVTTAMAVAQRAAAAAAIAFGVATSIGLGPLLLIVATIAAVIAIGYLLIKNWDTVKAAAVTAFNAVLNAIVTAFNAVISFITGLAGTFASAASTAFNGAIRGIASLLGAVVSTVRGIFNTVVSTITGFGGRFLNAGQDLIQRVISGWQHLVGSVASTARNVIVSGLQAVQNLGANFLNAGVDLFNRVVSGIRSVAGTVGSTARAAVVNGLEAVQNLASNFFNAGETLIGKVASAIRNAAGDVGSAARNAVDNAVSAVRGLAGSMLSAGEALIQGLINGITNKIGQAIQKVRDGVKKIKDLLPGSEPKDPSSPLRNLHESGQAIMMNMAAGIPRGAAKLTQVLAAELNAVPVTPNVNLAPVLSSGAIGNQSVTVNRHYHLPPGPGGGYDPMYAASQLDQLMRNEGAL